MIKHAHHSARSLYAYVCAFLLALCSTSALAASPKDKPDNSWISVSGTVASVGTESFILDYGENTILVEMDDWDWFDEAKYLLEGDNVIVYGIVDDDAYETKTIEADSVYVKGLNTYFYANPADEESLPLYTRFVLFTDSDLTLSGKITEIKGRDFVLDTGNRKVTVDTMAMLYNPLDKLGYQKLKTGDMVQVSGHLDYDLFDKRELVADTIVTLAKDKRSKSK